MGGTIKDESQDLTELNLELQAEEGAIDSNDIIDEPEIIVVNESPLDEETTPYDIELETVREAHKDVIKQIVGFISSIIPVLAALGYQFDWLTEDSVTMVSTAVLMGVSAAITIYSIWKNHYSSKKAQKQKIALKERGLK